MIILSIYHHSILIDETIPILKYLDSKYNFTYNYKWISRSQNLKLITFN